MSDAEEKSSSGGEDDTPVSNVPKVATNRKIIKKDEDWIKALSKEELKYFEKNKKSIEELEDVEIRCTACFKQVNHKLQVIKNSFN